MAIFDHPKPLIITDLRFDQGELALALSTRFSPADIQSRVDRSELISFLNMQDLDALKIRSKDSHPAQFVCQISQHQLALLTKSSIKKTRYLFDFDTLTLTINDRRVSDEFILDFLNKMDHIVQLIRDQKVIFQNG